LVSFGNAGSKRTTVFKGSGHPTPTSGYLREGNTLRRGGMLKKWKKRQILKGVEEKNTVVGPKYPPTKKCPPPLQDLGRRRETFDAQKLQTTTNRGVCQPSVKGKVSPPTQGGGIHGEKTRGQGRGKKHQVR